MFSSTLQKAASQANRQRLGCVTEAPRAPRALGGGWISPDHSRFSMHPAPHQGIGAQALGKKVSASQSREEKKKIAFPYFTAFMSPTSRMPAVRAEHKGHLRTEQTRARLTTLTEPGQKLGQPRDTLLAPGASAPPRPCSVPQVRAVSQGDGRLSHGTAASRAVTAEGKQLQSGLWRHFSSATSNPHARAKPWNRYCCNNSPVHSAIKGGGTDLSLFAARQPGS